MVDPADYELQKTEPPEAPPRASHEWIWRLLPVAVLAIAAAGYYFVFVRSATDTSPPGAPSATATPVPAPDRALGGTADPIDVPPLDASDALVRRLIAALSAHPSVAAWLATDNLIRNFTVVVENIATGANPARHLATVGPTARFTALERGNALLVDRRSYDRYDYVATAASSIDPTRAADVYATLKPRIEEAYRELGHTESFDDALERAIVVLLRTPVIEGDVRLEPGGAIYKFEDPAIERLTPAQKQLVRMGPRNMRVIQARLQEIALALGIPPARLPP